VSARSNLNRLIASSALSNLADGMLQITLPLVTLGITRNPGSFAAVTFVQRLPWLVFALHAGALADRLDRRRTMALVNLGRTALLAAFAVVVAGRAEQLWTLYLVAFVLGVGETLFDTAAQSILPAIVADKEQLSKANGQLTAVERITNQFIGPTLGALVAAVALAASLGASSAAYALAGVALLTLTGQFRAVRSGPTPRITVDIAEGVRYLAHHPLLRALAICVGVSNLASTMMFAIFPLYAIEPGAVGVSKVGYALLLTTLSAGTLVGSLFAHRTERALGIRGALLLAAASFPMFSLMPAITDSWPWLAVGFFAGALLSGGWNVITVSLRQRIVPDELLGRVNAGYRLLAWGTMPIGALLAGFTASQYGLRATFAISAAISAVCLPIVYFAATDRRLDQHRHGTAPISTTN
jgi:MFS family permease